MHILKPLNFLSESIHKGYNFQGNKFHNLKTLVEKTQYKENLADRFELIAYSSATKDIINVSKAASLLNTTIKKHPSQSKYHLTTIRYDDINNGGYCL